MSENNATFKCGKIALTGRPNAGKSTLMNALLNVDFSATSDRPQTTRKNIKGILQIKEKGEWVGQAIFLDTPGVNLQRGLLERSMHADVENALSEADIGVWVADSRTFAKDLADMDMHRGGEDKIPFWIQDRVVENKKGMRWIVVLNKADLVSKPELLPLMERTLKTFTNVIDVVPVAAVHGKNYGKSNLDALINVLKRELPVGPAVYSEDVWTDLSQKKLVENLIREGIFQLFRKEVPYCCDCQVIHFEEHEGTKLKPEVHAVIWVTRASLRRILVGAGGEKIKELGILSRKRYEDITGEEIILKLFVKVVEKWDRNVGHMEELGYAPL